MNQAQAMDRAHRIGQTRDVHIYRLVSSHTIEENMLRKAQKKQALDKMVIGGGDFTTAFLSKLNWKDWIAEQSKGKSIDDTLLAAEDEIDAHALKQARTEAQLEQCDFDDNLKVSDSEVNVNVDGEAGILIEEVQDKEGHIETYMFSWMLHSLNMQVLAISEFL